MEERKRGDSFIFHGATTYIRIGRQKPQGSSVSLSFSLFLDRAHYYTTKECGASSVSRKSSTPNITDNTHARYIYICFHSVFAVPIRNSRSLLALGLQSSIIRNFLWLAVIYFFRELWETWVRTMEWYLDAIFLSFFFFIFEGECSSCNYICRFYVISIFFFFLRMLVFWINREKEIGLIYFLSGTIWWKKKNFLQ